MLRGFSAWGGGGAEAEKRDAKGNAVHEVFHEDKGRNARRPNGWAQGIEGVGVVGGDPLIRKPPQNHQPPSEAMVTVGG